MLRKTLGVFALVGALSFGTITGYPIVAQALSATVEPDIELQTADPTTTSPVVGTAAEVYNQVANSVVAISTYGPTRGMVGSQSFGLPDNFFPNPGQQQQQPPQGLVPDLVPLGGGSGFIVSSEGYIITNAHVIDGAERIEINFLDGTIVRAEVVGVDAASDIAVLRVDLPAAQLPAVTFADSDSLSIGEAVLAIGSPFGQRWTLTEGIISALDRSISSLTVFSIGGVIQTDAAINPGNSGGPLLNNQGQVVGVNSQISTQTGTGSGIGYAVPSNLVRSVAERLIATGEVQYSYLGISGSDVSLSLIEKFGLANNFRGVAVRDVNAGSPAASAGLQAEGPLEILDGLIVPTELDIITHINDYRISGISDLIKYLATDTVPGDQVTLTVLRNGTDTITLTVSLTARPS